MSIIVHINIVFYLLCLHFSLRVNAIRFYLGDCPIYYEESCSSSPVKFILSISNENGTNFYKLNPLKPVLPKNFNVLVPLKIVIHGYGGIPLDISSANVSQTYQEVGYNVITVDWTPLAMIPCYPTAYLNTWHVGQCLAILAVSLAALGITPGIVHVVGFSLGAHIAGLAGHQLKNTLGIGFYRITGLDPALPFFVKTNNDWKLDTNDADFVDIVHTSSGTFGKIEATGHVDIYINGGLLQPFCYERAHPPLCSHLMAGIYFSESIRSAVLGGPSFIARKCENVGHYLYNMCIDGRKTIMGENVDMKARGIHFLDTSAESPFALGDKDMQLIWFRYK